MELTGKQAAGLMILTFGLVAGSVGLGSYIAGDTEAADTTDVTYEGEFEAVGLEEYEEPFEGVNFFNEMTYATESDDDTMEGAAFERTVSTAPSFVDRSAVTHFELDGDAEGVEMELHEAAELEEVSIDGVTFYDYESAVDNNDLERGERSVEADVESNEAEIDAGQLNEGEYALAVEYQFNDYSQAEGETVTLNDWTAELDTEGDVDEVEASPINLITE